MRGAVQEVFGWWIWEGLLVSHHSPDSLVQKVGKDTVAGFPLPLLHSFLILTKELSRLSRYPCFLDGVKLTDLWTDFNLSHSLFSFAILCGLYY